MNIGIDIQAGCGRMTGLGVYTRNLVRALTEENRDDLKLTLFSKEQAGDWNTFRRLYWENCELPRLVKKARVDILHVPAFSPAMVRPCKTVVTVHDLIGLIFNNQLGWPSRFYWGTWLPRTVRRADAIIADSENTKNDLMRLLKLSAEKITVIHPSGHEGFFPQTDLRPLEELRQRFGIREKYFLAVGTLEPRKNIARILEAYTKFVRKKKTDTHYQLVIAGFTDFAHGKFARSIRNRVPSDGALVLTGYLKREELNALYSGAAAFLFPSLYEGFGIPVLEAMASGTPVMTSRSSSLPEVAGEAAYYVEPTNAENMAQGLKDLSEDEPLRQSLIRKGFKRIQNFSWRDTAKKTLRVYEDLCG